MRVIPLKNLDPGPKTLVSLLRPGYRHGSSAARCRGAGTAAHGRGRNVLSSAFGVQTVLSSVRAAGPLKSAKPGPLSPGHEHVWEPHVQEQKLVDELFRNWEGANFTVLACSSSICAKALKAALGCPCWQAE